MNETDYSKQPNDRASIDRVTGEPPLAGAMYSYDPLIDRLVSGDLEETRRQELLAWLEEHPDRWRKCALAFLEAQLWRQAFDGAVRQADHDGSDRRVVNVQPERNSG